MASMRGLGGGGGEAKQFAAQMIAAGGEGGETEERRRWCRHGHRSAREEETKETGVEMTCRGDGCGGEAEDGDDE